MANWIAGAVKNKGGLHRSLGIPQGKKIPYVEMLEASKRKGKVGRQGRLALTLRGFH
jgi:hypothetical protein